MRRFVQFLMLGVLAVDATLAAAQEDAALEKEQIAEVLRLTSEAARTYQLTRRGDPTAKFELRPEPILKWSNPVSGTIYGNVFLWTHNERPMAVGSFYKWYSPWTHSSHEFHSLSTEPFQARYAGTEIWSPAQAGIEWQSGTEFSAPAKSSGTRLLQMRQFAQEFSVEKVDLGDVLRQMRLLAQPVYRYESPDEDVVDGALFVFVQGTDPEVWLLIEAIDARGELSWRFAFARMNTKKFTVRRDGRVVWETEQIPYPKQADRDKTYYKINTDALPAQAQLQIRIDASQK